MSDYDRADSQPYSIDRARCEKCGSNAPVGDDGVLWAHVCPHGLYCIAPRWMREPALPCDACKMAETPEQAKPSLSSPVWTIPTFVVVGHIVYHIGNAGRRTTSLSETLFYFLFVVPGSLLFLIAYATTIVWLRRSPRQLGAFGMSALATLAGLFACALTLGLLAGAFKLEAWL